MKYTAFFLLMFLGASCQQKAPSDYVTEEEKELLMQTVESFNQAFSTANIKSLDTLITQNYIHTNGSSHAIGRTQWMSYLKQRKKGIDNGTIKVLSYKMNELDITWNGRSAIITARIDVIQEIAGEQKANAYRVTNVWVLNSNRWKRAAFHDVKIM